MFGTATPETTFLRSHLVSSGIVESVRAPHFAGSVHSVFQRCVNILSGDTLVTLTPFSMGPLPGGIALATGRNLSKLGIAPEMITIGDGDCLRVPAADVVVDLTAPVWPARLPVISSSPPAERLAHNLRAALSAVSASGRSSGLGAPLAYINNLDGLLDLLSGGSEMEVRDSGSVLAVDISMAVRSGDLDRAIVAARQLVGQGIGLTPAGDDFLVGLSAALASVGNPMALPISAACAGVSGRTTFVAESFLRHASHGEYSGRLHDLLRALIDGTPPMIERAVNSMLAWGASSGADTLAGVAMGLAAVCLRDIPADNELGERTA